MAGSQAELQAVITAQLLTTHEEFTEAVDLQRTVWGFADLELLPVRLFVVASKVGGQVLGAYDGARMIGFCLAIPGIKHRPDGNNVSYLHSHMLGVLPEYNNRGVGRLLKLRQRELAIDAGIDLVQWTFDPLEVKNAFFNIERLGAIARRYVENQYGTTTSFLHGGLPTDRLVAEWRLRSARAASVVAGSGRPASDIEVRVSVPADIAEVRKSDPKRAREIQQRASAAFRDAFSRGLAVVGFERSPEAGTYLLGIPE